MTRIAIRATLVNEVSIHKISTLLQGLSDVDMRKSLLDHLTNEFEWSRQASHPILLTSDSIESLLENIHIWPNLIVCQKLIA